MPKSRICPNRRASVLAVPVDCVSPGSHRRMASICFRKPGLGRARSGEELCERMRYPFEKVRFSSAQPGEMGRGVAQEWAHDPGHLRPDQAENGHPDAENSAYLPIEDAPLDRT